MIRDDSKGKSLLKEPPVFDSDKCAFVCSQKPKQHQNHPNQTNPKGIIKQGQEVVKGSLSRCFSVIGCPRTFWGNQ